VSRIAKNDWWFKFEHLKWLTDEQLNRCSLETQGFWMRCICVMRKGTSPKLIGTEAELVRLLGVTRPEFRRCFMELRDTKTATVTQTPEIFTLLSRKYYKELKVKEQNRLRQRSKRRHGDVTPMSQPHSKSKSKETEKKEESAASRIDENWLRDVEHNPAYKQIPVREEFKKAQLWADTNGRELDRRFFVAWLNRIKPKDVRPNGTNQRLSEREKSAQRTINAERMANAIADGDEATVRRILGVDGQDHLKGYLTR
jgi:hypothetical protein